MILRLVFELLFVQVVCIFLMFTLSQIVDLFTPTQFVLQLDNTYSDAVQHKLITLPLLMMMFFYNLKDISLTTSCWHNNFKLPSLLMSKKRPSSLLLVTLSNNPSFSDFSKFNLLSLKLFEVQSFVCLRLEARRFHFQFAASSAMSFVLVLLILPLFGTQATGSKGTVEIPQSSFKHFDTNVATFEKKMELWRLMLNQEIEVENLMSEVHVLFMNGESVGMKTASDSVSPLLKQHQIKLKSDLENTKTFLKNSDDFLGKEDFERVVQELSDVQLSEVESLKGRQKVLEGMMAKLIPIMSEEKLVDFDPSLSQSSLLSTTSGGASPFRPSLVETRAIYADMEEWLASTNTLFETRLDFWNVLYTQWESINDLVLKTHSLSKEDGIIQKNK